MTLAVWGRVDLQRDRFPVDVARNLRIFIDGDRFRGVVAFDTWRGWADVRRRDDRGRLVMLAGKPQIDRRHGTVRACLDHATPLQVERLAACGVAYG